MATALAPDQKPFSIPGEGRGAGASTSSSKQNLFDLDRAGLERFFEDTLGEKRYRAHQVMKWIHHRYVTDFDQMTDLGKALRSCGTEHHLRQTRRRWYPQVAVGDGPGRQERD